MTCVPNGTNDAIAAARRADAKASGLAVCGAALLIAAGHALGWVGPLDAAWQALDERVFALGAAHLAEQPTLWAYLNRQAFDLAGLTAFGLLYLAFAVSPYLSASSLRRGSTPKLGASPIRNRASVQHAMTPGGTGSDRNSQKSNQYPNQSSGLTNPAFERAPEMTTVGERVLLGLYAVLLTWIALLVSEPLATAIGQLSPSLVMPGMPPIAELVTDFSFKYASSESFPSDHGTAGLVLAGCLWVFGGWRWGLAGFTLAVLFSGPRIVIGAHWISDVLVGSVCLSTAVVALGANPKAVRWLRGLSHRCFTLFSKLRS